MEPKHEAVKQLIQCLAMYPDTKKAVQSVCDWIDSLVQSDGGGPALKFATFEELCAELIARADGRAVVTWINTRKKLVNGLPSISYYYSKDHVYEAMGMMEYVQKSIWMTLNNPMPPPDSPEQPQQS